MPVGSHCFRVSRIGRLRLGPSSLAETYVLASELAVQLFDLRHKVGIESTDLNSSLT